MDVAGTELYFIDPTGDADTAIKVECDISSLNWNADTIDNKERQCISNVGATENKPGIRHGGTMSFSLNLDESKPSHRALVELANASPAPMIEWALGKSDAPGVDPSAASGVLSAPASNARTWKIFTGYISDSPESFDWGGEVTGDFTVQRSGDPELVFPTP